MIVVVVGNVTGAQGRAIVERFEELNRQNAAAGNDALTVRVRGLTRNKDSAKAQDLLRGKEDFLQLFSVDYNEASTFEQAFEGAHALFLNVIMSEKESHHYTQMLQAAMGAKTVRHVIYSSSAECQMDHGIPHWETSWHTEQSLNELSEELTTTNNIDENQNFTYHVLRYAHCNENMVTFYKPSKSGWMAFPWDPNVQVHTASVRDGARVACKLFLDPSLLPSGDIVDICTDFASPHEMAQAVSRASGQAIRAYKGPWIFLNLISKLAYEPHSIAKMGTFIEQKWKRGTVKASHKIRELLRPEIEAGEPLESVAAFCERHFGASKNSTGMVG